MTPFREAATFGGSNSLSLLVCLSPTAFPKNQRWDCNHQVAGICEINLHVGDGAWMG